MWKNLVTLAVKSKAAALVTTTNIDRLSVRQSVVSPAYNSTTYRIVALKIGAIFHKNAASVSFRQSEMNNLDQAQLEAAAHIGNIHKQR